MTAQARVSHSIRSRRGVSVSNVALKAVTYVILIAWALMVILPMAWSVMSALKTDQEIFFDPWALPTQWHWENFARAWTKAQIGAFVFNTLIVVIPSLFFTVLLSAMAAYVFARYDFRGKSFLFYLFLAGMMFPIFLALVPLYFLMEWLHLRNTFHGLSLVYVAYSLPFTIFFLVGFFKTLPGELAEAAIMDGASHYRVFFKVMLPLAKPGLVTVSIFNFLGQWNQYILPTLLMDRTGLEEGQTRYVLSQGLYYLQAKQQYANDWSGLFAAVAIVMIPTLLIYVIFHDSVEKGLTVGALKG
jgi:N-acetylglucosamine transport system permease protein